MTSSIGDACGDEGDVGKPRRCDDVDDDDDDARRPDRGARAQSDDDRDDDDDDARDDGTNRCVCARCDAMRRWGDLEGEGTRANAMDGGRRRRWRARWRAR